MHSISSFPDSANSKNDGWIFIDQEEKWQIQLTERSGLAQFFLVSSLSSDWRKNSENFSRVV